MIGEEYDHQRETDDTDKGPQHLLSGAGTIGGRSTHEVETMDEHQTETVEQRDDGEQKRIGVRREAPDHQVRADEQT